jgi:transcriptional regulator with XRE-family HTH domain
MALSKKIKYYRIMKGLSQEKLAQHTGISRNYLNQIENSKKIPSTRTLLKLSEELSVDAGFLLADDPAIVNLRKAMERDEVQSLVLELIKLIEPTK